MSTHTQAIEAERPPRLIWTAITVMALGTSVLWLDSYGTRFLPGLADALARLDAWAAAYVPHPIHYGVKAAASLYLTPWVYLTMMVVLLVERRWPAEVRKPVCDGMVNDFVGWFVLNLFFRVLLQLTYAAFLYEVCATYLKEWRFDTAALMPGWVALVVSLLAVDFLGWAHHYIRHKIKLLWCFHSVHHAQKELNMFTDERVHFVENIVTSPIVIFTLYLFGLNVSQVLWIELFKVAYTRINHANIRTNYGIFRHVLVSPQSHRIHHSTRQEHYDKNFGVILAVWDQMFGTQWRGWDDYPETGIPDQGFPHEQGKPRVGAVWHYFEQLVYPFRAAWKGLTGRGWELKPGEPPATDRETA